MTSLRIGIASPGSAGARSAAQRRGVMIVCLLAVVGCQRRSELFCQNNPDRCTDGGGGDDSNGLCGTCPSATPYCDPTTTTCEQCMQSDQCTQAGSPICDPAHVCRGCAAHSECPLASNACLPDGSCGDDDNVAYVDPDAGSDGPPDNHACKHDSPCKTIMKALGAMKPNIKLTGTITENVAVMSRKVTFVADPGTHLTATGGANVVAIGGDGNTDVQFYDVSIGGSSLGIVTSMCINSTSAGKVTLARTELGYCQAGGILHSSGSLTIERSSIHENRAYGIDMTGGSKFDITNTFVFHNGDAVNGTIGGVALAASGPPADNRFEFNTIADNDTKAVSTSAGVNCDIVMFHAANNLIVRNAIAGNPNAANANTFGLCTHDATTIAPDVTGLNFTTPGLTHLSLPPYEYKLMSGSSAIDAATTQSPIIVDQKGTTRPQLGGKDRGADEFLP